MLVEEIRAALGHKVYAIVNYDNFSILPELVEAYTDMVKYLIVFNNGCPLSPSGTSSIYNSRLTLR